MASKKSEALKEIFHFPPYKEKGLTVDIRSNGTVVLSAGKPITNDYMHRLSKEDSDAILNIIRTSIRKS